MHASDNLRKPITATATAMPEFTTSPPVRHTLPVVERVYKSYCGNMSELKEMLKAALKPDGKTLMNADITIAFPQRLKHMPAMGEQDAMQVAYELKSELRSNMGVRADIATDIFQTETLYKSKGYNAHRQQRFASASAFKPGDKRHYFILVDDIYERGSTLASLADYIESHGGKVLAMVVNDSKKFGAYFRPCERWIENMAGMEEAAAAQRGVEAASQALDGLRGKQRSEAALRIWSDIQSHMPTKPNEAWQALAMVMYAAGVNIHALTSPEILDIQGGEDNINVIALQKAIKNYGEVLPKSIDRMECDFLSNEQKQLLCERAKSFSSSR